MTRPSTIAGTLALMGLLAAPAHALPLANPMWITGSDEIALAAAAPAYVDDFIPEASTQLDPGELLNVVTAGGETFTGIAQAPVQVEAEQVIAAAAPFSPMASLGSTTSGDADTVGSSVIQADVVDEPGSLLMLGCGLVGVGFVMKRARA